MDAMIDFMANRIDYAINTRSTKMTKQDKANNLSELTLTMNRHNTNGRLTPKQCEDVSVTIFIY